MTFSLLIKNVLVDYLHTASLLSGYIPVPIFLNTMIVPVNHVHISILSDSQSARVAEWSPLALDHTHRRPVISEHLDTIICTLSNQDIFAIGCNPKWGVQLSLTITNRSKLMLDCPIRIKYFDGTIDYVRHYHGLIIIDTNIAWTSKVSYAAEKFTLSVYFEHTLSLLVRKQYFSVSVNCCAKGTGNVP